MVGARGAGGGDCVTGAGGGDRTTGAGGGRDVTTGGGTGVGGASNPHPTTASHDN